jgi:transposase-like protein
MSQENESPKKRRSRRSPEKILELVLEAERTGNAAAICRRENISPQLMYRWKNRFKEVAIAGFKEMKAGRPGQKATTENFEIQNLKEELMEVKEALVHTTLELSLLKKRGR